MTTTDVTAEAGASEAEVILEVTDAATAKVLEIRADEPDADSLGLEVKIAGVQGVEYAYELGFVTLDEIADDAIRYETDGLPLVIPADSVEDLRGATLDLPNNPTQGGLVIRNPNRPELFADDDLELTGTVDERLEQLLARRINPALASHGGWASLVEVDGPTAVVTMGGGCQGCAMSAATLREGISAMILQAVPEITEVRDVTDHNAGETPFYS